MMTSPEQMMLDVSDAVLQVEGWQMVANRQALEEGLVSRQAQQVTQVGLPHQDKGGQRLTVHLVGQEQSKLLKSLGGQKMGFIDDQEGEALFACGQVGQGSADSRDTSASLSASSDGVG